jgi:hypothetical protein
MHIMKKVVFIFGTVLFMLWSTNAWAEFKEGLWEITTQVEMKGMPSMPPTTIRQCISKKDPVPQNNDKNYDCKITDQKISGDTVSFTVECKGKEGIMKTSGTSTYTGTSMKGTSTTVFKMEGHEMQMESKTTGKYVGDCTK